MPDDGMRGVAFMFANIFKWECRSWSVGVTILDNLCCMTPLLRNDLLKYAAVMRSIGIRLFLRVGHAEVGASWPLPVVR